MMITGKKIDILHMYTLRAGLKLETLGMKRHGRSCYIRIKEEFGLKGNKLKVLEQFEKMVKEAIDEVC